MKRARVRSASAPASPFLGWDPVRCACRECVISQKAVPVCGDDGKTYMNRELAACAGAGISRVGNCDCRRGVHLALIDNSKHFML